ncbi:hypothetical protein CVT26_013896 [Gymnopilus dilepis]|uniref:F-box domain-containing protein n=1 Tax=Gymnopilus dilepis TaxID=231916 RepID=A0A409WSY8_9AGAR|nr:hypothetical protein CVT26_013896 [Gymnopilus dilepis]
MKPPTIPVDATFFSSIACLPDAVIYRLFSFVQLEQLILLSKTCWLTRYLVRFYSIRAWSFYGFFRRWFTDSRAFQRMLERTRAVISGSQVVQFFDRAYYPESDLDIYVQYGFRLGGVSRRSSSGPITRILNLEKDETLWDGTTIRKRIQIIGLDVQPLNHILFEFHSTAVMNFMTANVAVSVFPKLTFIDRMSLALKAPKKKNSIDEKLPWQDKYRDRGFHMVHEGPTSFLETRLGRRSAVDCKSWKMPLGRESFV